MDSLDLCNSIRMEFEGIVENKIPLDAVSYTHLTLPTT